MNLALAVGAKLLRSTSPVVSTKISILGNLFLTYKFSPVELLTNRKTEEMLGNPKLGAYLWDHLSFALCKRRHLHIPIFRLEIGR